LCFQLGNKSPTGLLNHRLLVTPKLTSFLAKNRKLFEERNIYYHLVLFRKKHISEVNFIYELLLEMLLSSTERHYITQGQIPKNMEHSSYYSVSFKLMFYNSLSCSVFTWSGSFLSRLSAWVTHAYGHTKATSITKCHVGWSLWV
jgi:hypothetical protein